MRRAIVSDIHANMVALEAVLADVAAQQAGEIVCLGDICGYGPDPIECVDRIHDACKWVLCGNHDAALFMSVAIGFNRFAREAIEWQRSVLMPRWYSLGSTMERWKWLEHLMASRIEGHELYVHASPRDPLMEYVEEGDFADMGFGPSQKVIDIFDHIDEISFCGHTHRPGVGTSDFLWKRPDELPEMTWHLQPGSKTLVNVGSVGQPRDNNPKSCYVIYDTEARTVTFRRIEYDIVKAQERFRQIPQLSERLWRRLESGT